MARFFRSPAIAALKESICEIGRRAWARGFVDGNAGNITVRVGDNLVLCTPTLVSKGFMRADDIGLIDFDGRQLAGTRPRTSEAMTHLGIMRRQPLAGACVHAHPPHATAFALTSTIPPAGVIAEAEIFLGPIGLAPYRTPGSPEIAAVVGEAGADHACVLMENHGVICWGRHVEEAYWRLETIDACCHTIWIASQLGRPLRTLAPEELEELAAIRRHLGAPGA